MAKAKSKLNTIGVMLSTLLFLVAICSIAAFLLNSLIRHL